MAYFTIFARTADHALDLTILAGVI